MQFPSRVIRDLKADYRKTLVMVVLMGVFIYAWLPFLKNMGGKSKAVPEPQYTIVDGETRKPIPLDDSGIPTESCQIPVFLGEALPFDDIAFNPFRSLRKPEESKEEGGDLETLRSNKEAMAQRERELLDTIRITCTLIGSGKPAVVIDGKILEEGTTYKGFVIEKIEEGSVTFKGKLIHGQVEVPF